MKWAILGAGNIANDFARSFKTDKAELYAVASRSQQKADTFAAQYNIPVSYGNYEEMLADATIDAVYIATPHSHHYEQIKQCLNAGKHVFSEKVMVTSRKQLDEVMQLAAKKNLYLAEAMTIFHMPLYPKLKQWIKANNLGKLKYIHVPYGSIRSEDSPMYFYKPELAGGALFDIGTYALTFALEFMTSQPEDILTFGNLHESGVDETSVILLKNKEKELATITLSFATELPQVAVVAFQNGYLEVPGYTRAKQATFTDLQGNKTVIETTDSAHAFTYEINNFTNMVLKKGENPTLAKTKDVMTIMDTLRKEWGLVYPFD